MNIPNFRLVRPALRTGFALVLVAASSARAVTYDFFTVTITGTNTAKFTSPNGNGFILATTLVDNWTNALYPQNNTVTNSAFTNLFLPSGVVQGWLTRYETGAKYTNIFVLTNYSASQLTNL